MATEPLEGDIPPDTDAELTDPQRARAEAEIARDRERLTLSVRALRAEVARRADWREWVRARPLTFVGAGLAVGLWLGLRRR